MIFGIYHNYFPGNLHNWEAMCLLWFRNWACTSYAYWLNFRIESVRMKWQIGLSWCGSNSLTRTIVLLEYNLRRNAVKVIRFERRLGWSVCLRSAVLNREGLKGRLAAATMSALMKTSERPKQAQLTTYTHYPMRNEHQRKKIKMKISSEFLRLFLCVSKNLTSSFPIWFFSSFSCLRLYHRRSVSFWKLLPKRLRPEREAAEWRRYRNLYHILLAALLPDNFRISDVLNTFTKTVPKYADGVWYYYYYLNSE